MKVGLYNFQKRFVPFILSGEKTHTIRGRRVNPDKPGNTLHLYTGLRQKGARLLMRVACSKVEDISIRIVTTDKHLGIQSYEVAIDGIVLDESEAVALSRRDGFSSFQEMMKFWQGRLPFEGQIVHWRK